MLFNLLALSAVAAAQTMTNAPTPPNSAQLAEITADYNSWVSSYIEDPSVQAVVSRIASDIPEESRDEAIAELTSLYDIALDNAQETTFDALAYATSPITSLPTFAFLTEVPAADASSFFAIESSLAAGGQSVVASVLGVSPGGVQVQTPTYNGAAPAATAPPMYKLAGGVVAGVGMAAAAML